MKLIINNSSMQPIYEQIVSQVKKEIMRGELQEGEMLPSVRTLAKDLKVSALTVKKAYDALDAEGFVVTVHGKGSFVTLASQEPDARGEEKGSGGRSGDGDPQRPKLRDDQPGNYRIISDCIGGSVG